jgi:hypothetical protein
MADEEYIEWEKKYVGKYKSMEEFKKQFNKKEMTNNKKTTRVKMPTDKYSALVLWNRYRKANKTYRQTIVSRYGYKNTTNFVNKLKEQIK